MIKIKCVSSLDNFRCELKVVCCRPEVGDLVGCYLNFQPNIMKIHSIRHCIENGQRTDYKDVPYLELCMVKN
jgi:hypothetical protein